MNTVRTVIAVSMALGMAGLSGCGPKMSKMAQSLTPVAANFYVLNQDVGRARGAVRSAVPEQSDMTLPQYDDLLAQMRTMGTDIASETELKKHEDLRAAIAACLDADTILLAAEKDAVASYAAESRLGIEINDLAVSARGNTIRMRQIEGQLGALSDRQQRHHAALLKVLPQLAPAADRCRGLLQRYNTVAAAESIVTYFNDPGIYDPFGWERGGPPRRRPAAKPAAKSRTAKKAGKRR